MAKRQKRRNNRSRKNKVIRRKGILMNGEKRRKGKNIIGLNGDGKS